MRPIRLEKTSFAGHETFPLRYTWLPKAVEHVDNDPQLFGAEDAMVTLGVGKNMVRAIRHWGLATGVLGEDPDRPNNRGRYLVVTELGEELFGLNGWDPFFEDQTTAWLLHWQLCSRPEEATTWYWAFNHLPQPEFRREDLAGWLMQVVEQNNIPKVSPSSMKRDVDCFLRTYVPTRITRHTPIEDTLDSPLVELGLIRGLGGRGNYLIQRGEHPSLPDGLVAYALAEYIERQGGDSKTLPLDVVAFAPGSPGRVFALHETALLARLERLSELTKGALVFDQTAGLRQILIHERPDPSALLAAAYEPSGVILETR